MLICLVSLDLMGQSISDFEDKDDFKEAEPLVLKECDYLLSNPIDKDESKRMTSFQYVMKWMEGTPDHTFTVTPEAMNLIGDKSELLPIYLSSLTKAALENEAGELSSGQLQAQGIEYLIEYCSKPQNNVKPSKGIKKEIKARSK